MAGGDGCGGFRRFLTWDMLFEYFVLSVFMDDRGTYLYIEKWKGYKSWKGKEDIRELGVG